MNDNFIFSPYRINISAIIPSLKSYNDSKFVPITKEENTKFIYSFRDLKLKKKRTISISKSK